MEKEWLGYLLGIVIFLLFAITIMYNHFMLTTSSASLVIAWGTMLIMNIGRSKGSYLGIKITLGILTLLLSFVIGIWISHDLELDSGVSRSVIDYAMDEGLVDSKDVDLIIHEGDMAKNYTVLVFNGYDGKLSYDYCISFIYSDGDVSLSDTTISVQALGVWTKVLNHEWSGDGGIGGQGFYFYEENGIKKCTHFYYGSGLPVIHSSTSEVKFDEYGLMKVAFEMDMDKKEKIDLEFAYINDKLMYDDMEFTVKYEGNSMEYILK